MKLSADRLSGLFFLLFGIAMYFAVIPAYVEQTSDGNIAPNTLPNAFSIVIATCGFLLMIKPTEWELHSARLFATGFMYLAIIAVGVYAISWFGFVWIAPILALIIMLVMGERRPFWLAAGVIGTPFVVWLFVVKLLDRALP